MVKTQRAATVRERRSCDAVRVALPHGRGSLFIGAIVAAGAGGCFLLVFTQMSVHVILGIAGVLLLCGKTGAEAETLQDALRDANVPARQFPTAELERKITSYAISNNDPFLLAYYADDGSGRLRAP